METTTPMRMPIAAGRAITVCFLLTLSLPILDNLMDIDRRARLDEKRDLAPRPVFPMAWETRRLGSGGGGITLFRPAGPPDWAALKAYPREVDRFVDDHFGFRTRLVHAYGAVSVIGLRESPTPRVILGKSGWFYYAGEGMEVREEKTGTGRLIAVQPNPPDFDVIRDYRATDPLSDTDLQRWAAILEARRAWLAQRGARYVFVIVPNKHTIYPEYLPDWMTRVGDTSRAAQLIEYLRAHTAVTVVDLRPALSEARTVERSYHRTDTHWNDIGAWHGYRDLVAALARDFPALAPLPREEFRVRTLVLPGLDLAGLMGAQGVTREEYIEMQPRFPRRARSVATGRELAIDLSRRDDDIELLFEDPCVAEIDDPELPRGVMLRDSFGIQLIPYLSEHFSRIAYTRSPRLFPESLIVEEAPDIVIQQMVERNLMIDPPVRDHSRFLKAIAAVEQSERAGTISDATSEVDALTDDDGTGGEP